MRLPAVLPDLTPLRTSRDFRAVFGSRAVAMLGTQAAEVALIVQAKQRAGARPWRPSACHRMYGRDCCCWP